MFDDGLILIIIVEILLFGIAFIFVLERLYAPREQESENDIDKVEMEVDEFLKNKNTQ